MKCNATIAVVGKIMACETCGIPKILMRIHHCCVPQYLMSNPVVPCSSYSPLDPRFAGSNLAGVDGFFQSVTILSDFLWKGSKAVGPVS